MKRLTLLLDSRERQLILEHGYPFDGIKRQCEALQDRDGPERIVDDAYWWEQLAGNLAITINEDVRSPALLDELHELIDRVEALLQFGSEDD